MRYRTSFLYASGDHNPTDGRATGFDSIFDNPNFAGGDFSFFIRQQMASHGHGCESHAAKQHCAGFAPSKEQGQANFVNPGLFMYNAGMDIDVTPKLKMLTNVSFLQFANTKSLQLVEFDDKIGRDIGIDYSVGFEYRPFLNNNVICVLGLAGALTDGWLSRSFPVDDGIFVLHEPDAHVLTELICGSI